MRHHTYEYNAYDDDSLAFYGLDDPFRPKGGRKLPRERSSDRNAVLAERAAIDKRFVGFDLGPALND